MSLSNVESQALEDIERQRTRADRLRWIAKHFRVLIIGRANAGKTTILQRVCNTTEQPKIFNQNGHEIDLSELNPTAQRGEHDIENEMIFESNTAFVFHDSRGFKAGRTSELDKVKDFVRKCSTNKELKDHLHVIWYCIPINDEARPFTRAELNFFDECGTGRVPVIVLFTKADMLDAQTINWLVDTGMDAEDAANKAPEESLARFEEKFGQQLYKKKYPPKDHVYFRDMQNPTSDCSELLRKTAATFL
ncbi:small GTP-binding protein domain [Laccaria bicolor S238N-H82]|uniref:Small GTP-binding protein domain n=1 Tax=Laccaria bicolor (strain S238N-H82 / ATCC MYA-4686) TaxID=486041 RepID=B0DWI6_LACBS|nr:small GTP-binding protein domain [Laccaria bicolor S238N-H82]EDR01097.1 small GTP-binding protein domain [Laccaria bicolor S238N-H82]|eukprot:XP_001888316.1 small GTP-binding protein domain [Laccaria bicolor S238N-H82]